MDSVTVVAIQPFLHEGRQIHKGEAVTLSVLQAAERHTSGHVSLDPQRRPTYRTRALVAEAPAPEPPVAAVAIAEPPPIVPTRRTYRRRSRRA